MMRVVDVLEERVVAAADLIASLRAKAQSLEQELLERPPLALSPDERPAPSSPDPTVIEELERLRAERVVVRESIRGLLREIDRMSW